MCQAEGSICSSRLDDNLTNQGKRIAFKGRVGLRRMVDAEEDEEKELPAAIRAHAKICSSRDNG